MTETINLICFNCKHYREAWQGGGCDAFPNGIPDEILEENEHSTPIHGQDNDIVFEPIEVHENS